MLFRPVKQLVLAKLLIKRKNGGEKKNCTSDRERREWGQGTRTRKLYCTMIVVQVQSDPVEQQGEKERESLELNVPLTA